MVAKCVCENVTRVLAGGAAAGAAGGGADDNANDNDGRANAANDEGKQEK
jgi:hypothetical protein